MRVGRLELHPGAWIGGAFARLIQRDDTRDLLLNALTPAERLTLAARALAWEGRGPEHASEASRLAIDLARSADPAHVAIELARGADPAVRDRIHAQVRAQVEVDDRNLAYLLRMFAKYHRLIAQHAGGVAGKQIVELGPGYSLATGLLLVASGASRWTGVDPFPIATRDPAHYRALRDEVVADRGAVRGPDRAREQAELLRRLDELLVFVDGQVVLDEQRIAFLRDTSSLPDASQDLVLSNAVLEHVRDPEAAIRESLRVLAPGGIGVHQIDLRDHRDFSRPLEFLCLEEDEWLRRFEREPFEFTNRWRQSELLAAFERAGADLLSREVTHTATVDAALRARLTSRFRERSAEDLETTGVLLVVRRAR